MSATPAAALPRYPVASLLLLAALALFWGLNWPAIKLAVNEIPVLYFRSFTTVATGPVLLLLVALGGEKLRLPRRELAPLLLMAFLNVTSWHVASAYSVKLMPAGRASIIAYTMPVWTVLFGSLILGERLTAARLGGLALGIAGMVLLLLPDLDRLRAVPAGALIMLGAALLWAAGTVGTKRVRWTISAAQLAGWQLTLGGVPILIAAVATVPLPEVARFSATSIAALLYASYVGMLVCQWIWFKVLRLLPAGVAAIGTLAIPVVGVFSSAWLLGEAVGRSELAALALVVLGIALVLLGPGPASPPAPAAAAASRPR